MRLSQIGWALTSTMGLSLALSACSSSSSADDEGTTVRSDDRPDGDVFEVDECDKDDDCEDGQLCDNAAGRCVECKSHDDCGGAEYCSDGQCLDDECAAGEQRCGDAVIEVCDELGMGFEPEISCRTSQRCIEDAGQAECVDPICDADEYYCEGREIRLCDDDEFSGTLVSTCPRDEYCVVEDDEPGCEPYFCIPGESVCDGNTLTTCKEDGSGPESGGTDCAEDVCVDGECQDLTCRPDEIRCNDGTAYTCDSEGMSEDAQECAETEYCEAGVGCQAKVCEPSQPSCDGNEAVTCKSDGSGFEDDAMDCEGQTCVMGVCREVLFAEDFEDGDYDGWQEGDSSHLREVVNGPAANGSEYSLRMETTFNLEWHMEGVYRQLPQPIRPIYVSYWVYPTASSSGAHGYVSLSTLDPALISDQIVFMYFDDGLIRVAQPDGVATLTVDTYSPNNWYHFELSMDWDEHTVDFTINGELAKADVPFRDPTVGALSQISLYNFNDAVAYWDEFLMY